jgi:integrase
VNIAGRSKLLFQDKKSRISHQSIYTWIDAQEALGKKWERFLKFKGKPKNKRKNDGRLPNATPIEGRPEIAERRGRIGDFEGDTVHGLVGRGGLVTLVDRKSRYLLAEKVPDLKADTVTAASVAKLRSVPQKKRKSTKRMIEEMRMRDYSERTISAYVSAIYRLAAFYHQSPDKLNREQIRAFLVDLVEEKRVAWSYYKQVLAALRYFYRYVVRRGEIVDDVRGPRTKTQLPIVLSVEEVARFFKAIPSLKHRTILMLAYGAGLRVGEAVRVRLADIDRDRNVLRITQGKRKKDRYTACGSVQ